MVVELEEGRKNTVKYNFQRGRTKPKEYGLTGQKLYNLFIEKSMYNFVNSPNLLLINNEY